MKNLKNHLGMEYPVALYMTTTGGTTVSLNEINDYCEYLNGKFDENKDCNLILCSSYYLQEMAYRFSHLFQLNDNEVRYIGKNMSGIDKFKDLRSGVIAYLSTTTLVSCLKYTEQYFDLKNKQQPKTKVKKDGKTL